MDIYNEERLFVLLDEVQYVDNPSNFLKLIGDHHKNIRLIVSGSSSFEIRKKFKNSLVGRTVIFEIFNLSFAECLRIGEFGASFQAHGGTLPFYHGKHLYFETGQTIQ